MKALYLIQQRLLLLHHIHAILELSTLRFLRQTNHIVPSRGPLDTAASLLHQNRSRELARGTPQNRNVTRECVRRIRIPDVGPSINVQLDDPLRRDSPTRLLGKRVWRCPSTWSSRVGCGRGKGKIIMIGRSSTAQREMIRGHRNHIFIIDGMHGEGRV